MSDAQAVVASVLHVVQVTIEAVTPISSSSGESLALQDNALARDANGLPVLMGPTLAGVLRHVHREHFWAEPERTDGLFGWEAGREGEASRIEVSFGYVHDGNDRPIDGLRTAHEITSDPLLRRLSRSDPVKRDHVAIDARGVAEEHRKFQRVSVPAGTRFTLELAIEGDDMEKDALLEVVRLLRCPTLRLGGATRRGLGRIAIVEDAEGPRVWHVAFDRAADDGWSRYATWRSGSIGQRDGLDFDRVGAGELKPRTESCRRPIGGRIVLEPEGWWRLGQGAHSILGDEADQMPFTEDAVAYANGAAQVNGEALGGGRMRVIVPGSGIKGALAHRTAFELNRIKGIWADNPSALDAAVLRHEAIDTLLGAIKESTKDETMGRGEAGSLLVDDGVVLLEAGATAGRAGQLSHNSLDRFTQGVRNKILFKEESLWRGSIALDVCLLTRRWDGHGWREHDPDVLAAFRRALGALLAGKLAIGADSGDGHGYCSGRIEGELEAWLEGTADGGARSPSEAA